MQVTETKEKEKVTEVDIYRDTTLRLLGYANEVGESFRSLVNVNVVRASYGVAFGYVLADTADKTKKNYKKTNDTLQAAQTGIDCLLWQTLASVAIPGFTINRICAASLFLLKKTRLSTPVAKWTTMAIGLGSIGLIYQPIDNMVEHAMDRTYRKIFPLPADK